MFALNNFSVVFPQAFRDGSSWPIDLNDIAWNHSHLIKVLFTLMDSLHLRISREILH